MKLMPSRHELLQWARTAPAKHLFPVLIRKLIYETAVGLQGFDIPGEEGTALHGFDGFVVASASTPFVPEGRSVWEISVKKSPGTKASEDIAKRDAVPDGTSLSDCTYVAVLLAPWGKRREWAQRERERHPWRAVKALGVDSVITWLEDAPAASAWLMEQMGFPVQGIVTANAWWQRWIQATEPTLSSDMALAGRQAQADLARERFVTAGVSSLGGELGADELIACAVASASAEDSILDRMLVVDDRAAWRWLMRRSTPLILIPLEPSFLDDVDADTPHSVLVPTPYAPQSDIAFPSIRAEELVEILRTSGLPSEAAHELGQVAARSLVAFRRRIAKRHELMRPTWTLGTISRPMRAALLAGSWDDEFDIDREIVGTLTGAEYEEEKDTFLELARGDDPFLTTRGGRFHLVSAVDAWMLLGKHVNKDELRAFGLVARRVLGSPTPRPRVWHVDEKRRSVPSSGLRRGLATSLALLGTYGDVLVVNGGRHGSEWANEVVHDLLGTANDDPSCRVWASLSDSLPALAEASPRVFLDGVSMGLDGDVPMLARIFEDAEGDALNAHSPHTGLLWALETLAWSADYFARAVQILAKLAEIDPGGRLANRPTASLASIFCPWRPETAASKEQQLAALDLLRRNTPDIAWTLMESLLPRPHDTHFPTRAPTYRSWRPRRESVLRSEYVWFIDELVGRMVADAGHVATRWHDLLGAWSHLSSNQREVVRTAIGDLSDDGVDPDSRAALWEKIRETVAFHREHSDAHWAISEDELLALEATAASLAPQEPSRRHRWLFQDNWAYLGDVKRRDDYHAYNAARKEYRASAISEIVASCGLNGVLEFATSVSERRAVGIALAETTDDLYLNEALSWLDQPEGELARTVAEGFIGECVRTRGDDWGWKLILHRPLPISAMTSILLASEDVQRAIDRVRELDSAVAKEFWRRFSYFGLGAQFPAVIRVAEELNGAGRWGSALHLLSLYARENFSSATYAKAVATAFEGLMGTDIGESDFRQLASHDFELLFAIIDRHVDELGLDRVTTIEWYFFPALGFEPSQTMLHRRLASDPRFFLDVVCLVYLREGEQRSSEPAEEAVVGRAEIAWRLLESWHVVPGMGNDQVFDPEACRWWIKQAESLLEDAGRLKVGRECIGAVLAHAPTDEQGTWPDESVRDLIEDLASEDLLVGLERELFNRRGAHGRALFEGGDQERKLAGQYRVQEAEFRFRWPRLAEVFAALAEIYEAEARREDEEVERRRRGLDR